MCRSTVAILQPCPHKIIKFMIIDFAQTYILRKSIKKDIIKEAIWVNKTIISLHIWKQLLFSKNVSAFVYLEVT